MAYSALKPICRKRGVIISKNHIITIRLDESEYALLQTRCKQSGLSTSNLVRYLLRTMIIQERPSPDYRILCREVDRIGNNINQIAKRVNSFQTASSRDVAELVSQFSLLKAEVQAWRNKWL